MIKSSPAAGLAEQADSPASTEKSLDRHAHLLGAGLLFALLTLAYTWNMWGSLTTAVPGGDIDGFENAWNNWWVRKALLELGTNPLFTNYIYYPTGVSLRLHALQPLNGLFTIPLAPLFGALGATNLTLAAAFFLTAFFSYLLFFYLSGHPLASLVGASFFAFCNHQLFQFWGAGQGNLISLQWLPLYLLFMLRVAHRVGRRWLNTLAASFCLLLLNLTDLQYLGFAVLITLVYAVYRLSGKQTWLAKAIVWRDLAVIGLIYGLVALPLLLVPAILEITRSPWLWPSPEQSLFKSSTLFDYLGWEGRNLGYLPLALAGVGLLASWRKKSPELGFWVALAALFGVLSLGPVLQLNGSTIPQIGGSRISLPYAWLSLIPGMQVGRNPSLFQVVWMLAVCLLAVFGWRWLLKRWFSANSLHQALLTGGVIILAIAPLIILGMWSYRLDRLGTSAFYEELARDKDSYAILDVPVFTSLGRGENVYQGYQVIHNKPRFGGRMSRDHKLDNPNNFIKTNTLFRDFFWLAERNERKTVDFMDVPDYRLVGAPLLNFYQVRYIVLYRQALDAQNAKYIRNLLDEALNRPQPVYEDELLTAYRVPDVPPLTQNGGLFLDVGPGWYTPETRNGETWRWAAQPQGAEVYLYNLNSTPREATLDLLAYSFKSPRAMTVKFNDKETGRHELGEERVPISLRLNLQPGRNVITFSSDEPGRSVADFGVKGDSRVLSFGMLKLKLHE